MTKACLRLRLCIVSVPQTDEPALSEMSRRVECIIGNAFRKGRRPFLLTYNEEPTLETTQSRERGTRWSSKNMVLERK